MVCYFFYLFLSFFPFSFTAVLTRKTLGHDRDAFDFFTVSMTVSSLAREFKRTKADITWGITLVLMLRSVGAITFGLAADKWGRKWPFIINNVLFIVLEMGTGFCKTFVYLTAPPPPFFFSRLRGRTPPAHVLADIMNSWRSALSLVSLWAGSTGTAQQPHSKTLRRKPEVFSLGCCSKDTLSGTFSPSCLLARLSIPRLTYGGHYSGSAPARPC